jgi:hypothetical protein
MNNNPNQKRNIPLRRLMAGAALAGTVVAGIEGVQAATHKADQISVDQQSAFHPEQLSDDQVIPTTVKPGQGAEAISYQFAAPGSADAENIQVAISHEDQDLQPGDELRIPKVFVEPDVYHPEPSNTIPQQPVSSLHNQQ